VIRVGWMVLLVVLKQLGVAAVGIGVRPADAFDGLELGGVRGEIQHGDQSLLLQGVEWELASPLHLAVAGIPRMQGTQGAERFSIFALEDHPEFETLGVLGVGAEVTVDYLLRGRVQAVEGFDDDESRESSPSQLAGKVFDEVAVLLSFHFPGKIGEEIRHALGPGSGGEPGGELLRHQPDHHRDAADEPKSGVDESGPNLGRDLRRLHLEKNFQNLGGQSQRQRQPEDGGSEPGTEGEERCGDAAPGRQPQESLLTDEGGDARQSVDRRELREAKCTKRGPVLFERHADALSGPRHAVVDAHGDGPTAEPVSFPMGKIITKEADDIFRLAGETDGIALGE
jgi:hypothetical protein